MNSYAPEGDIYFVCATCARQKVKRGAFDSLTSAVRHVLDTMNGGNAHEVVPCFDGRSIDLSSAEDK